MRSLPLAAVIVAAVASPVLAGPQPPYSIYPRVESHHGTQTIVLDFANHTKQPLAICTSEHQCLTVEVKDAKGAWVAWELLPLPTTPPVISVQDILVIPAGESRDAFSLPVTPFGGTPRDFGIGTAHHVAKLPTQTEYRFTYQVDATAHQAFAKLKRDDVAPGPEGSSASPMELRTFEHADIIAAVKKGEPGTSAYVLAGDSALLPLLDPLLDNPSFSIASSALYCVIATEAPEAVERLLHVLRTSKSSQLRSYASHGFHTVHPRAAAPQLLAALDHETDEYVISGLVLGLGEMDDPALIDGLHKVRARLPAQPVNTAHPGWGTAIPFDLAGARLGDPAAVRALADRAHEVSAHMTANDGALADLFRELPYTHSAAVAAMLAGFLGDHRGGSRAAPYRDGPAPRNAKDAQAMADFEKRAYVRVADDAAFAILAMFPDEPWTGVQDSLHVFSADELRKIKTVVDRRLKARP